jgi:glutamate/tyrosine decarboxylase-like PLP-dependent enzyme
MGGLMMASILADAAARAQRYLDGLDDRPVAPQAEALAGLAAFDEALPAGPSDPHEVLELLDRAGTPATVASGGGRYFGFVTGGSLPAAMAANWLAAAWDQNTSLRVMSPAAVKLEDVANRWLTELLGLPADCGVAYTNGATMANLTGLAAARHALLARRGWDVELQGLFGAPELTVVVGDEVHVSVLKALSLLGLGRERVVRVPVDGQGRMLAHKMPKLDSHTIVCAQTGNVNTGAFDPLEAIGTQVRAADAWLHIDGAVGLWAAAAPQRAELMRGHTLADSWVTDGHKWLNVPYDCGMVFVKDALQLRSAMTIVAPYLQFGDLREPQHYGPDYSRRARGVEVWAALRSLGQSGFADLIERCCQHASVFAEAMVAAGHTVLNDVVLNQVLVSFGDAERTRQVIAAVQQDGTCWCGGTVWQGHTAMRISVSSWATTEDDVRRSVEAICRVAAAL